MSRALREEYATDAKGRCYRVNHTIRVTKGRCSTHVLGHHGLRSACHMERAFTQRREQVIGNLLQLQTDVEVYNDQNPADVGR